LIANTTISNIKNIKTVLIPEIQKLDADIAQELSGISSKSPLADYSIEQLYIPKVVNLLIEKGLVKEAVAPTLLGNMALNVPMPDNVREVIKTDDVEINAGISEIVSTYSDEDIKDIWDKYMTNINSSNTYISNFIYERIISIKKMIVVYGMVCGMIDNYPGLPNIDVNQYKEQLNKYKNELLNYIAHVVKQYNGHVAIDKLVVSVVPSEKKIYVIDQVYGKALKEGVTPEAILGLLISNKYIDREMHSLSNIIANRDELSKATLDYIKLTTINNLNKAKNALYDIAVDKAKAWYTAFKASDKGMLLDTVSVDYFNRMVTVTVSDVIKKYNESDVISYHIAKNILCYVLFTGTNALYYIDTMERYLKSNAEVTPAQAAVYATIDYIVRYITTDMWVDRQTNNRLL
jgi:hypothetical protein